MVSQDLLDILRCPVCVHNQPEGGELGRHGSWLICQDCDRKYPIRDDIPVMLIDEGDRFQKVSVGGLPAIPPSEAVHTESSAPSSAAACQAPEWLPYALIGAAVSFLGLFIFWLLTQKMSKQAD